MALVSSAEISAWVNAGDSISTSVMVAAERRATAWLEVMTGVPLDENDGHVLVMRGSGVHELVLPYPVKPSGTLTTLEVRYGIGDSWVEVTSSNYERLSDPIRNTEILLRKDDVFPRGEHLVRSTMQVGYDDSSCPEDLKRTLLRLIAFDFQGRFLTYSEADSDRRQTKVSEMPWDVQATIKRYRRKDWASQMLRSA